MQQWWKQWQERWRDPALTGLLIVQVFLLFVLRPLTLMIDTGHERWEPLAAALATAFVLGTFVLMLLALLVVSRNRKAKILVLVAICISAMALLAGQSEQTPLSRDIALASSFLFTLTMAWVISRAVFAGDGGAVTYHRITGAIVLYFVVAEIFASLYELVLVFVPDALSGINTHTHLPFLRTEIALRQQLIYFSFSALTTASFGDILPTHPMTKSLANLESIFGQMFPATLLARIVTLEIEARRTRTRGKGEDS